MTAVLVHDRRPVPLAEFLAVADEPVRYRIEGVLPIGGRAVLAAQYKAGKTTVVGNLTRSLADGDPFLDRFGTVPGRVTLIDDEMDVRQLRRWLREQGISNTLAVKVLPLRGLVAAFDIINPTVRAEWVQVLRGAEVLIFDCLRPVLDALGLDENRDAGRFLVAFDALLKEAGIGEAIVVHHMGHGGERSRGDSRLRDWPDVEWRLVRPGDDSLNSARRFSAFGRDVDISELTLTYTPAGRRLTGVPSDRFNVAEQVAERTQAAVAAALADVIQLLSAAGEPLSRNRIEERLKGTHPQKVIREAIARGVATAAVTETVGAVERTSARSVRQFVRPRQHLVNEVTSTSSVRHPPLGVTKTTRWRPRTQRTPVRQPAHWSNPHG